MTTTFGQIAESLASNYDEIYYVEIADSSYIRYEVNNLYGQLEISKSGEDFFRDSFEYIPQVVHKRDVEQVCDSNNLKQINDTRGHATGDEYIRASARLLCDIFVHSPVFRVGGDEFIVFLRGNVFQKDVSSKTIN